jgi:hypothetical protein
MALAEMRARDSETDPKNILQLVNAIIIAHLEGCSARSIRQGSALGPQHPMVLDAAAWVSEVRGDDDVRAIARRIHQGLAAGLRRLEAEAS